MSAGHREAYLNAGEGEGEPAEADHWKSWDCCVLVKEQSARQGGDRESCRRVSAAVCLLVKSGLCYSLTFPGRLCTRRGGMWLGGTAHPGSLCAGHTGLLVLHPSWCLRPDAAVLWAPLGQLALPDAR